MKSIINNSINELVIKNSRFITLLIKFNDNDNLEEIISGIKLKYPKATHCCYGYITENHQKSSDDGEPGGTAGMPILNILEKEEIVNVLVVVVRYFGGIKLGAGGLVRAYSKSVKNALENTELITLEKGYEVELTFNYDNQKEIDYLLKDIEIINKSYLEQIKYNILISKENLNIIDKYNYKIIKELLIKK